MAKKKKKQPGFTPPVEGALIEFAAPTLVDALGLLRTLMLRRAARKDLASYHFAAGPAGMVTISAMGQDVAMQLRVEALRVVGTGTVMIDSLALNALMGSYKEPRVTIHLDDADSVVLLAGRQAKLKVPAYDPAKELKAPVPSCLSPSGWVFEASALLRAIRMTRPFTDAAATRYALSGLLFRFPEVEEEGLVAIVATDGRRLARALVPARATNGPHRLFKPTGERKTYTDGVPVIPDVALAMAEKLAKRAGSGAMAIAVLPGTPIDLEHNQWRNGKVQIVTREACLTADLVEGKFPLYEDVFAGGDPVAEARLDRAGRLAELLDLAVASTNSESRGVDVTMAGGCIMLMAESDTRGKSQLSMVDVDMTGQGTFVADALMFRQLLDVLEHRPVTIQFWSAKEAIGISSGSDWSACLMPLSRDRSDGPTRPAGPMHEVVAEEAKAEAIEAAGDLEDVSDPEDPGNRPQGGPVYFNGDEPEEDDGDDDGSIPVEDTMAPPPLPPAPVAVTPDAHEGNGEAKPARKRKK